MALQRGHTTPDCAAIARNHGRPPRAAHLVYPVSIKREMSAIIRLLFEEKRAHLLEKASSRTTAFMLNDWCGSDQFVLW